MTIKLTSRAPEEEGTRPPQSQGDPLTLIKKRVAGKRWFSSRGENLGSLDNLGFRKAVAERLRKKRKTREGNSAISSRGGEGGKGQLGMRWCKRGNLSCRKRGPHSHSRRRKKKRISLGYPIWWREAKALTAERARVFAERRKTQI